MNDRPRSTTTLKTRREVLRRRRRERQLLVFGALVFALGATGYSAYAIYSGKVEGPFAQPYVTVAGNFSSDITLPCPPADTPLPEGEVMVRVLNSTERTGLASNTRNDLVGRGFQNGGAENYIQKEYEGTAKIVFGVDGVHAGYTVARHFVDPELVLDSRIGAGVDVILGLKFDGLVPIYSSDLDSELMLTAAAECLPAGLISPVLAPSRYPKPSPAPTVEPTVAPPVIDETVSD